jgi:hypothetical protein
LEPEVVNQLLEAFRQPTSQEQNEEHQRLLTAGALVQRNLGEMFVESSASEGTTFWFSLPLALPLAIAKRYFETLAQQDLPEIEVSLVEIAVEADASTYDMTPVIDEFLQQQSAENLVMAAGPDRWLFLLQCPAAEIQKRCDQLSQEWLATQEETPADELPKLACNVLGSWNLTAVNWKPTRSNILRHFAPLTFAECDQQPSPLMLIV